MHDFIPVYEPKLDGNEYKYLQECIASGWISSEGPFVGKFETLFAQSVHRKFGIAVSNGTAALEIALLVLGLEKGDEVIVPSFTIISCLLAIIRVGAKPVLVDSDNSNWNMDVNAIEDKITNRTRAILVVHTYGLPVEMDKVLQLSEKYGLKIIEDAAEMHGQKYFDKPCGSFGNISVFSFYANKLITTGEGGMIVTDDEEIAKKCSSYRNLCFCKEKRFLHYELGYNFRITNLQAAVGVAQLERMNEFLIRKKEMGALYTDLLEDDPIFQLPLRRTEYAENVYWIFGVVLSETCPVDAAHVMEKLTARGIGTRPFFYPMHKQPVFRELGLFKENKLPVSERLGDRGFYLPIGLTLADDQIIYITTVLKKIVRDLMELKSLRVNTIK
jgi:perosamine synthetase